MNSNNEQTETIERYLNRQLSPDEVTAFENNITQDAALAAEVAEYRLVHELITDRGLLDIKQKMQNSRYDQYFNQPKGNNYLYGGIGLGLLLISVASYVWYTQPSDKTVTVVTTSAPLTTLPENNKPISASVTEQNSRLLSKRAAVPKPINPIVANVATDETIQPVTPTAEPSISVSTVSTETKDAENTDKAETNVPDVIAPKVKIPEEDKPEESKEVIQKSPNKNVEFAFSPSLGQVWEFPMEENASCKITILNKSAQIVHEMTILNGFPNSWNGTSNRGISITMGSYIYLFEYQNGQVERGYVTITQ